MQSIQVEMKRAYRFDTIRPGALGTSCINYPKTLSSMVK